MTHPVYFRPRLSYYNHYWYGPNMFERKLVVVIIIVFVIILVVMMCALIYLHRGKSIAHTSW